MSSGHPVTGHAFVIAVEYQGDNLDGAACDPQTRAAIREHAYDLSTAALADHTSARGDQPRVGFPAVTRGWNTEPDDPRCIACDDVVSPIIRAVIRQVLTSKHIGNGLQSQAPLTRSTGGTAAAACTDHTYLGGPSHA